MYNKIVGVLHQQSQNKIYKLDISDLINCNFKRLNVFKKNRMWFEIVTWWFQFTVAEELSLKTRGGDFHELPVFGESPVRILQNDLVLHDNNDVDKNGFIYWLLKIYSIIVSYSTHCMSQG